MARDRAVEQSLDAALELDELLRGGSSDSQALAGLVEILMGKSSETHAAESSQTANLYRRASAHVRNVQQNTAAVSELVAKLLRFGKGEAKDTNPENLRDLRDFCLGINRELVAEAFRRVPESPFTRTTKKDAGVADLYRVQHQ